jgi:ABC-type lipoprotein export system ATPase subunit
MGELLTLTAVSKSYKRGDRRLRVLNDVSLEVGPRDIVAVVGSRDEGKTTLLKVAASLEKPDSGEVWLGDQDLTRLSDARRSRLLGAEIAWTDRSGPGMRVQMRDYVGLPQAMGRGVGRRQVELLAGDALERVGAPGCARQRWEDLSNWERVLVGFARGIVGRPKMMFVDDLLDGLGMGRTREAGQLLRSLADELGCGVLVSVCDLEAALIADRVWSFGRGKLKLMSDQTAMQATIVDFPGPVRSGQGSSGMGS